MKTLNYSRTLMTADSTAGNIAEALPANPNTGDSVVALNVGSAGTYTLTGTVDGGANLVIAAGATATLYYTTGSGWRTTFKGSTIDTTAAVNGDLLVFDSAGGAFKPAAGGTLTYPITAAHGGTGADLSGAATGAIPFFGAGVFGTDAALTWIDGLTASSAAGISGLFQTSVTDGSNTNPTAVFAGNIAQSSDLTNWTAVSAAVTGQRLKSGDTTANTALASTPRIGNDADLPILPGSIVITDQSGHTITDDGNGTLIGDVGSGGTKAVNYSTGARSFSFSGASTGPVVVSFTYTDPIVGKVGIGGAARFGPVNDRTDVPDAFLFVHGVGGNGSTTGMFLNPGPTGADSFIGFAGKDDVSAPIVGGIGITDSPNFPGTGCGELAFALGGVTGADVVGYFDISGFTVAAGHVPGATGNITAAGDITAIGTIHGVFDGAVQAGANNVDAASFTTAGLITNSGTGTAAIVSIGSGADGTVSLVADAPGVGGNAFTVEVASGVPTHNVNLSAVYTDKALLVTLGTDNSGVLDVTKNTATLIAGAINTAAGGLTATASGTGATALSTGDVGGPTNLTRGAESITTAGAVNAAGYFVGGVAGLDASGALTFAKGLLTGIQNAAGVLTNDGAGNLSWV
jgi:hypothetical protein